MEKQVPDWNVYASIRNLSRNRLLYAHHSELVDEFVAMFGQMSNDMKVLDVGPGNGFFMTLLRELGFINVDGLEISHTFLEALRHKNLCAYSGNIENGDGLGQLSPPYDMVLMMEILEHIEDPQRAINNAKALLAKNGLLYITVPICDCIFSRLLRLKRRVSRAQQIMNIDPTHIHSFTKHDITNLLTVSGFTIRETRRVSFNLPVILQSRFARRILLLLRSLAPNIFRGMFLTVLAQRDSLRD